MKKVFIAIGQMAPDGELRELGLFKNSTDAEKYAQDFVDANPGKSAGWVEEKELEA